MQFLSLVSKGRKPKFDLHLKIYDLNNVPLVSGASFIKWHLPHSIHKEHRGRTPKCPITNHRVEYIYGKIIPLRIAIDKLANLAECWIEFEVLQEFNASNSTANVREEKVTLGIVRINLSEYIEESEAILRNGTTPAAPDHRVSWTAPLLSEKSSHHRKRSSMSGLTVGEAPDTSPRSSHPPSELEEDRPMDDIQDGVIRRYLMQESKINSTLKISILMVQVDGERNFVAPPLKTAPVFGGIAGFVANESLEPPHPDPSAPGRVPSLSANKSRDASELQDMYRRALAASWASQPDELPADQCIEDIFAGGDGFRSTTHLPLSPKQNRITPATMGNSPQSTGSSGSNNPPLGSGTRREDSGETSADDETGDMMGTLRPRDIFKLRHRLRGDSGTSERSNDTMLGEHHRATPQREFPQLVAGHHHHHHSHHGSGGGYHRHSRQDGGSRDTTAAHELRSRSGSATSLATTLGSSLGSSERGRRDGFKRAREVDEFEVREDMVAWAIQGVRS